MNDTTPAASANQAHVLPPDPGWLNPTTHFSPDGEMTIVRPDGSVYLPSEMGRRATMDGNNTAQQPADEPTYVG